MTIGLILIGLAAALDPLPLTAFMLVLPSKRGVLKGAELPTLTRVRGLLPWVPGR